MAFILAASAWGQLSSSELDRQTPFQEQERAEASFANGASFDVPEAQDSPFLDKMNQLTYGNPYGIQPEQMPSRAATVSVDQLRHRVSRKGAKLLDQAHRFVAKGLHDKAIAEYKLALGVPSAVPYAHSLLGAEYLRLRDVPDAIGELKQAIDLLPHTPENLSNLALAFLLEGDVSNAEHQVQLALAIDAGNAKTRQVLSQIRRAEDWLAANPGLALTPAPGLLRDNETSHVHSNFEVQP